MIKGFTLDDERLKQGGGEGYFSELLARIRDICSSEKIFWSKVLDIDVSGKISHEAALNKARMKYFKYQPQVFDAPSLVEGHFLETIEGFEKAAWVASSES